MNLPMWLGLRLQDTVGELFSTQTGLRIRRDSRHYQHPAHPWMLAHLDFRLWGHPKILVEAKTASSKDEWGAGPEEVPDDYWIQCQHEMAVVGADLCHLAVLFLGRGAEFRDYSIPRNEVFIERMIPALSEFWHDHVLTKTPPPADGTEPSGRFLRTRYPADDGLFKTATPEQVRQLVEPYELARHNVEMAKAGEEKLKQQIQELIGPNAGLLAGRFKITYKLAKDADPKVRWDLVAKAYRAAIERELAMVESFIMGETVLPPRKDLDAIESLHTEPGKPGTRRFLFTEQKEAE